MRHQSITAEQIIARLASRAHGVVSREELLAAGVTLAEIRSRLASGALIRVYPGVYRVGHRAPSVEAWYMAAVKACGEGAVLSGTAAAHLYGLIKGRPPTPEVTTETVRRIRGIQLRRSRHRQATTFRAIPITTVPRTLIDLAAVTNRIASERRVDCRWPDRHLTVELISYRYHRSRHAWENDQRRQREAYARGDAFRTYTHDDVFERPAVVVAELHTLLA